MSAPAIDPARCRWVFRDDEWRLMKGPADQLAAVRREAELWTPYRDGQRLGGGWTYPPDARTHVERVLRIGHVMVSERTTGG